MTIPDSPINPYDLEDMMKKLAPDKFNEDMKAAFVKIDVLHKVIKFGHRQKRYLKKYRCRKCGVWVLKEKAIMKNNLPHCPDCGRRLRERPRRSADKAFYLKDKHRY